MRCLHSVLCLIGLSFVMATGVGVAASPQFADKVELGRALFHDANLSQNRSQSCATCHMPDMGFADRRETHKGRFVSLGDDGKSFGDRNAPTVTYAALVPTFGKDAEGRYVGGQFWDGRAKDLDEQAEGPLLNAVEMGMKNEIEVAGRLAENPAYVEALATLYGVDVKAEPLKAFKAAANAIASFERSEEFATFDSKYDRYLRGEEQLTDQEELGRTLFFSKQFTNCNQCHDLRGRDGRLETSTFTSHRYFNIGVPVNREARALNGIGDDFVDDGLAGNKHVGGDPEERGKFRVPTLRNVAVTGPYMHNGVFADLRTVILFYNKYNSKKKSRQINPETGERWADPEVPENIALEELESGPALDDKRIDALVAFLKTLTDRRYEHLFHEK